jgi:N6-adenosine-specific RNA methylase IME4
MKHPQPRAWSLLRGLLPPLSEEEEADLRQDIRKEGVHYPIKILLNGLIVDGYHRWKLSDGKAPVEVVSLNEEDALGLGLRLNLKRRHVSREQRDELIRELRRLGRTQEQVAELTGFSRSLVDRVENVNGISNAQTVNVKGPPDLRVKIPEEHHAIIWQRAKKRKEPFSKIAGDYKVTEGRISQLVKSYEKKLDRSRSLEELKERANHLPVLKTVFSTIVVDPPWPYGSEYDPVNWRGATPYPEMSLDEIRALKIPAAQDCALWLWTTNKHLHEAFHIVEAWGFTYKTLLTWAKHIIGLGRSLRGQTEHCILAVKGSPKLNLTNQSTLLQAHRREHSRKPDEFYDMVTEICEEPRLDYFGREPRTGWSIHGTSQIRGKNRVRTNP